MIMADKIPENKFLYISKKDSVIIRFMGGQVQLYQYFPVNPTMDETGASLGPLNTTPNKPFLKEHDDGDKDYVKSKRIVSLVIDRSDEKIKAFVCPISAWNQLTDDAKENDFEIWKEGMGLQTRYHVKALGINDVTEEQECIVNATLASFTFSDIFIKDEWELVDEVVERIEERWEILDL